MSSPAMFIGKTRLTLAGTLLAVFHRRSGGSSPWPCNPGSLTRQPRRRRGQHGSAASADDCSGYTRLVRGYGLKQEFIMPHSPEPNGMAEASHPRPLPPRKKPPQTETVIFPMKRQKRLIPLPAPPKRETSRPFRQHAPGQACSPLSRGSGSDKWLSGGFVPGFGANTVASPAYDALWRLNLPRSVKAVFNTYLVPDKALSRFFCPGVKDAVMLRCAHDTVE